MKKLLLFIMLIWSIGAGAQTPVPSTTGNFVCLYETNSDWASCINDEPANQLQIMQGQSPQCNYNRTEASQPIFWQYDYSHGGWGVRWTDVKVYAPALIGGCYYPYFDAGASEGGYIPHNGTLKCPGDSVQGPNNPQGGATCYCPTIQIWGLTVAQWWSEAWYSCLPVFDDVYPSTSAPPSIQPNQ